MEIGVQGQESFYRTATLGLRALDGASSRRPYFGAEADASWSAIVGALRPSDRLDLLIRNAAVGSPAAFAPRVIFAIPGLADDEPFGPDWIAPPGLAEKLLAEAAQPLAKGSPEAVLSEAARAWGLHPEPPTVNLASITPGSRILAAGAGAILVLAEFFHRREGFDLGSQVALVTAVPGERQLLGLAAALLGSAATPRSFSPGTTASDAGLTAVHLAVVSPDAARDAAETAATLARELGI